MATKFYLESSGSTDISPSVHSAWTGGTAASFFRAPMDTTKAGTALTTFGQNVSTDLICVAQFISKPLAAQSISGSFNSVSHAWKSTSSGVYYRGWTAWVAQPDGSSRGTLNSNIPSNTTSAVNTTQRSMAASGTLSSVSAQDGDYLIVEFGWQRDTGATNTKNLRFGSSAASDLAYSDGTTTDNNPSIQMPGTITFYTAPAGSGSNQLMLVGVGV